MFKRLFIEHFYSSKKTLQILEDCPSINVKSMKSVSQSIVDRRKLSQIGLTLPKSLSKPLHQR